MATLRDKLRKVFMTDAGAKRAINGNRIYIDSRRACISDFDIELGDTKVWLMDEYRNGIKTEKVVL